MYYYGARWYDAYLNRWIQPDSIIPDPGNSLDWDRYSYVRNNPIKYTDPSGHDVDCAVGETECRDLVDAEKAYRDDMIERYGEKYYQDVARQDHLFSQLFNGSVSGQAFWTASDWEYYYVERASLWDNPPGGEAFPDLLKRLSSYYTINQKSQYVDDVALMFAGMPTVSQNPMQAALVSQHGPILNILNVPNRGLANQFLENHRANNQSHHYAAMFYFGYYFGKDFTGLVNVGRDWNNLPDLLLGIVAGGHGEAFLYAPDYSTLLVYIFSIWSER